MILAISTFLFSYAYIEGWREACYFHFKIKSTDIDLNEHTLFSIQRGIFIAIMSSLIGSISSLSIGAMMFLSLSLMFPIIHESAYYETRHKLDDSIYPKGWKNSTTTSNAKFNFSFNQRVVMFFIGLALMIVCIIIK